MAKFLKGNFVLLLILFAAGVFRFLLITQVPGGLFPDEAANGLDVNSILRGQHQPFFERGNGREGMFFYLLSLSVLLFGRGHWQHHIVSAGIGFFEVLTAYFLARRLFGKNVALLATFFMAVSSYAVTMSRTSFRANLVPLFTTLTLLFVIKVYQEKDLRKKYLSALGAGISFGLGFYTYISFRMMIPLLLAFKVAILVAFRDRTRELLRLYWKPKLLAAGGFFLSFSWLGYYFLTHPGSFVGRAGQVSIFSDDLNQGDVLGTFFRVLRETMLGFFTQGDLNWRHNVSGFPFLTPLISPFFAAALIIFSIAGVKFLYQAAVKKFDERTFYKALIAAWFWAMIIPEITTAEGIPHGLRLVGVIPAIYILSAWGVFQFWIRMRIVMPKGVRETFAIIFLGFILVYNFYLYFGVTVNSPENYYAFRSDLTAVSKYLNERARPSQTFLSLDKFSVQTVDYLTSDTNRPYTLVDPASTYQLKLNSGDQVIFTMSTLFDRTKFLEHHKSVQLIKQEHNRFGQVIMQVYQR